MLSYLLALIMGAVAGSRTFTAPMAVSWATYLGHLELGDSWLHFFGNIWTCLIFTALALGEYYADQHPSTPSRKAPGPFAARLISGGLCGAAIGVDAGSLFVGLLAGVVGALAGTLGFYAFRAKLAAHFGRDRPAAFIEDAIAIGLAFVVGVSL